MKFSDRLANTKKEYMFTDEGYFVWCGTMMKYNGFYYMLYSRWKKELGFNAWVTDSEICLAKADSMFGKFQYVKTILSKRNDGSWDGGCAHNPTVIEYNGMYYLYYMGNNGDGEWWTHRNNQRVGVAYTDNPEGEWKRFDKPIIDISEEGIDSLMTSNPSVTLKPDGEILMVYKAVSKYGELPRGGSVICGVATADNPLGPFKKEGKPIMVNPEAAYSVEDPFIWCENGHYYSIVKDFKGYFTKTGEISTALFESENGFDWKVSDEPLAYKNEIHFINTTKKVHFLERPQIFFEDEKPKLLMCACMPEKDSENTFNIRIPFK